MNDHLSGLKATSMYRLSLHAYELRAIHFLSSSPLITETNCNPRFSSFIVLQCVRWARSSHMRDRHCAQVGARSNRSVSNSQENRLSTFIIFIILHLLRVVRRLAHHFTFLAILSAMLSSSIRGSPIAAQWP